MVYFRTWQYRNETKDFFPKFLYNKAKRTGSYQTLQDRSEMNKINATFYSIEAKRTGLLKNSAIPKQN